MLQTDSLSLKKNTHWDVVLRVAEVARYKHRETDWLRRGCKGCEVPTLRDGLTETWLQGLQRLRGTKTERRTDWDVVARVASYKDWETDWLRRGCKGCKGCEAERRTDWDVVARVARVTRYKDWETVWLRRGCKGCRGCEVQTLRDGLTETWLQGLQRLRGTNTERRTDWDVVARVTRYKDWETDWLRRGCKGCKGCELQRLRDGLTETRLQGL